MCCLVGMTALENYKTNGYDIGYFKKGDQVKMDGGVKIILQKLRPQAIPLIELYDIPDAILTSAIGNSYGDIYETHLDWAKNSRMNQTPGNIPKGFKQYILPILQGKL